MLEFRKDPVIGRWVIFSSERKLRPSDYEIKIENNTNRICPFCKGNEDKTPPEILVYRPENWNGDPSEWTLRVFPNKFPALQIEGKLHRKADGIYDKMVGIGAHEVVVETPDHNRNFSELPVERIKDVFRAFQERITDLQRDTRLRYTMIFKNHGRAAGASLMHSHSQLIATPIVPKRVAEELKGALAYYNYKDRCVFCDILEQELDDQIRNIEENESFVALAPFASRFPFETWIVPRNHQTYFEKTSSHDLTHLASILSKTLQKLDTALNKPPFNLLIHNAPYTYRNPESYHWHIEIIPISSHVAGFEWGTGFYINPIPPEEATQFLRASEVIF